MNSGNIAARLIRKQNILDISNIVVLSGLVLKVLTLVDLPDDRLDHSCFLPLGLDQLEFNWLQNHKLQALSRRQLSYSNAMTTLRDTWFSESVYMWEAWVHLKLLYIECLTAYPFLFFSFWQMWTNAFMIIPWWP